jgi:hypothetical protein
VIVALGVHGDCSVCMVETRSRYGCEKGTMKLVQNGCDSARLAEQAEVVAKVAGRCRER